MRRLSIMVVAGEASGDLLGAELVESLRSQLLSTEQTACDSGALEEASLEPEFFGAGGARMAAAGVQLIHDLTARSVIGPSDVIANYTAFQRIFRDLLRESKMRKPDVVVLIDFSHFNQRLGAAIRQAFESERGLFHNWRPLLVKYVSPQVWASRPGRAKAVARTFDLLMCILPFEAAWYAKHAPSLRTVYVGHWIMDRYPEEDTPEPRTEESPPLVLLLPGSRPGEIHRHTGVLVEAARKIRTQIAIRAVLVVPSQVLATQAQAVCPNMESVELHVGNLPGFLKRATIAIAATGSVTLECARFGLPTVALYRTSWLTYQIAKRVVTVSYLAMPNLLANEALFPEFIQEKATPEAIGTEALALLTNDRRRATLKTRLREIIQTLGNGGASDRAAKSILQRLQERGVRET